MSKYFLSILFSILLMFGGCAEKPNTSLGSELLSSNDLFIFSDTTLFATTDTTYRHPLITGYSTSDLIGRTTSNEEFVGLFKFQPLSASALDSLRFATIDSARISIVVNYRWGATESPAPFEVREILQPWGQSTFTADSVTGSTFGSSVIGSTAGDSMVFARTVNLYLTDTSVVRRWISSIIDTGTSFNGFSIHAKTGVLTGVVGFETFNSYSVYSPTLHIIFTHNGIKDSVSVNYGEDTYAPVYQSTPVFDRIELRGGVGVRSVVTFDVGGLKDKPIVTKANMLLTMNSVKSDIQGFSADTVIGYLILSETNIDSVSASFYAYGIRADKTQLIDPVYSFSVTTMTQQWINNIRKNNGVSIRWGTEFSTAEKAVFYSSIDPDTSKRPQLRIEYAKK